MYSVVSDGRVEGGDIVGRDVHEPLGQRLERLLLRGLSRRGERGERAAVKRPLERDDLVRAWLVRRPPPPRELDPALGRLGPRVREEHPPTPAEKLAHFVGEFGPVLDVEQVAHVHELARLLGERRRDRRMRMAEVDCANPAHEIEVLSAVVVVESHPASAHEHHGLARVGLQDRLGVERDGVVECTSHGSTPPRWHQR